MKVSILLNTLLLLSLFPGLAFGKEDKKSKKSYSAPFGMAGCGLGSLVISEKDKNSQIIASTINSIFGFVSSSITSGTSNCNYDNNYARIEQQVFIAVNLRSLEREAAVGEGRHLDALAQLFGCEQDSDRATFFSFNRDNFTTIYGEDDPDVVFDSILTEGKAARSIVKACPGISS
jgi:hypothetical protein